jgi:hypothetical protein
VKLDNKTVAALSLGGKTDLITFDDQLPGFGYRLRAGAGGKVLRSWIAQYRHHNRTRRLLIGSGDVLSADQARTAAKKVLAEATLGNDPQGERSDRRDRDAVTFRAMVGIFGGETSDRARQHPSRGDALLARRLLQAAAQSAGRPGRAP